MTFRARTIRSRDDRFKRSKESLKEADRIASGKIAEAMREGIERVTATWSSESKPRVRFEFDGAEVSMIVDGRIFGYVDQGTKPHDIAPKRPGGRLVFTYGGPGSYTPKTQPGLLASGPGGQSGETTYARVVKHPGTKARNFLEAIAKDVQEQAIAIWRDAIKQTL